jgi:hypothetical protein
MHAVAWYTRATGTGVFCSCAAGHCKCQRSMLLNYFTFTCICSKQGVATPMRNGDLSRRQQECFRPGSVLGFIRNCAAAASLAAALKVWHCRMFLWTVSASWHRCTVNALQLLVLQLLNMWAAVLECMHCNEQHCFTLPLPLLLHQSAGACHASDAA